MSRWETKPGDGQHVDRSVTHDLIGDMDPVSAHGVAHRRPGHIPFTVGRGACRMRSVEGRVLVEDGTLEAPQLAARFQTQLLA
jgi:hypothetical protein